MTTGTKIALAAGGLGAAGLVTWLLARRRREQPASEPPQQPPPAEQASSCRRFRVGERVYRMIRESWGTGARLSTQGSARTVNAIQIRDGICSYNLSNGVTINESDQNYASEIELRVHQEGGVFAGSEHGWDGEAAPRPWFNPKNHPVQTSPGTVRAVRADTGAEVAISPSAAPLPQPRRC